MNYIVFDIECSNCYLGIGKICEFGYAVFDSNFNIISKDDIQINPGLGREYRFDKNIKKRDPKFEFAYEIDSYFECEEFPFFYERIKHLIINKNVKVLGYSVDNDIRYLSTALKSHGFEEFSYEAYDIQKIVEHYHNGIKKPIRLDAVCEEVCSPEEMMNLTQHLSRDDAIASMLVLKNICNKMNLTIEEILTKYDDVKIDSISYLNDYYQKRKEKRNRQFEAKRQKKKAEKLKKQAELELAKNNA